MIKVFIDAESMIKMGKPPGGAAFDRLLDLTRLEEISIVTTDLTEMEVSKKHADNEFKHLRAALSTSFQKLAMEYFDVSIPKISHDELYERILSKYKPRVELQYRKLRADRLSIDSVKASGVFKQYHLGRGFFWGRREKRSVS